MKCYNGIKVNDRIVPCGQCMPCRINKRRVWSARILLEEATTPALCWFVTLTYDDENLPLTPDAIPTLLKKATSQWVQNQRKAIPDFRYYLVGEYGSITLRPHYHLAIFPQDPAWNIQAFCDAWSKGFSSAYPMSSQRAAYLAQYTTKKLTADTDERLEPGQEPEFRTGSPGLGVAFVPGLVAAYRRPAGKKIIEDRGDIERTVRIGGKVYPLAEYLLRKARQQLGIPLLHSERLNHLGYYAYHNDQEAEQCPETYIRLEEKHAEETRQKEHRTRTNQV